MSTRATQVFRRSVVVRDAETRATQVFRRTLWQIDEAIYTRTTQVFRRTILWRVPCTSSRCQMWSIRRRDGQVLRFTSHDRDLSWRAATWSACDSLIDSAASASGELGSSGDVTLEGIISAAAISEQDLYGGLYDDAFVEVWIYDWGGDNIIPVRIAAGWIGEVSQGEKGFTASVMGPSMRLDQNGLTQVVTPGCRYSFGDARCGVDAEALKMTGAVETAFDRTTFTAQIAGVSAGKQWSNGVVTWTGGNNAGVSCEVKSVSFGASGTTGSTGQDTVQLWIPAPLRISAGDTFDLKPGCDKAFESGCALYANKVNFGGFPHLPGMDELMDTPDAKL